MIEIGTTRFRLTDGVSLLGHEFRSLRSKTISSISCTKDSAPGPDGLPYALWRVFPQQTAAILKDDFHNILAGTLAPPTQVGVWIPKAKQGPTADFFRPLGMPDTLDRLQDGTLLPFCSGLPGIASILPRPCSTPSENRREQYWKSKEPLKAPHLPLHSLRTSLKPSSVSMRIGYFTYYAFASAPLGSSSLHVTCFSADEFDTKSRDGSCQREMCILVLIWGDLRLCTSSAWPWTPIFVVLNRIPQVVVVAGYVDDTTIVGHQADSRWVEEVFQNIRKWKSAGIVMDMHHCWQVGFSSKGLIEDTLHKADEVWCHVTPIHEEGQATCSAALQRVPSYARHFVLTHGDHCIHMPSGTREAGKDSLDSLRGSREAPGRQERPFGRRHQGGRKGSIGQSARHQEAGKSHLVCLGGTREAPGRLVAQDCRSNTGFGRAPDFV